MAPGISGAPRDIDSVGSRAEVSYFNNNTEAPLMKLDRVRPVPRMHPIPGGLFVTVRELDGEDRVICLLYPKNGRLTTDEHGNAGTTKAKIT